MQGWSTERTLKALERERQRYHDNVHGRNQDVFNQFIVHSPVRDNQNERIVIKPPEKEIDIKPYSRLSPLNKGNVNGEELVPLLAKQRAIPLKIPLGTTDATRGNPEK